MEENEQRSNKKWLFFYGISTLENYRVMRRSVESYVGFFFTINSIHDAFLEPLFFYVN